MRRRLAVTAVVVTALVGEWLGHGISYFRAAGLAGLQAGLGGGIHAYMLPLAAVLLAAGMFGAAALAQAWLSLGRRFDSSARLLARLRRGDRAAVAPPIRHPGPTAERAMRPSPVALVIALAMPLAVLQSALYLVQENLERALRGLPAGGFGPLLDGNGAAAWIQAGTALVLTTILTAVLLLLRARRRSVERIERLARSFWRRTGRDPELPPHPRPHVIATQLLLGSALWQPPPPASSPA